MNIAVDAMGGDYAPEMVVQGAVEAASGFGIDITLVGDENRLRGLIDKDQAQGRIFFRHCEHVVEMDESPLKALRKKKDASIGVAFDLVKHGLADAVISAGNSGATLAAAVLTLGRLEGVERPGIATILPTERGCVVLIDVGANVDCRPGHLFQFGVMAQAFACSFLGIKDPRIGLLNIGEEKTKGNEQVRSAYGLFQRSDINFVGNVEGRDIPMGTVDIVVCDGFVGNVVLKTIEGNVESMVKLIENELMRSSSGRTALELLRRPIDRFRRRLDYEEYGGAPLLGAKGVGVICHGESSAKAIRNAINTAAQYVNTRVLEKMSLQLKKSGAG